MYFFHFLRCCLPSLFLFSSQFCGAIALIIFLLIHEAVAANRIVTIDASITEIAYALGVEDKLVGRDITSNYPKMAMKLPSVGYVRALTTEGILSLNPDLILVTKDAKPQLVLDQLKKSGIPVEVIDNQYSIEGVIAKINAVAQILHKQQEGKALIKKMKQRLVEAKKHIANTINRQSSPTALFVLQARGDSLLVSGNRTRANALMDLVGIKNLAKTQFKQYKPMSAESILTFNPDWVIMMPHTFQSVGDKARFLSLPAIANTTAGKERQLLVIDGDYLSFGPRLGDQLLELSKRIR